MLSNLDKEKIKNFAKEYAFLEDKLSKTKKRMEEIDKEIYLFANKDIEEIKKAMQESRVLFTPIIRESLEILMHDRNEKTSFWTEMVEFEKKNLYV